MQKGETKGLLVDENDISKGIVYAPYVSKLKNEDEWKIKIIDTDFYAKITIEP